VHLGPAPRLIGVFKCRLGWRLIFSQVSASRFKFKMPRLAYWVLIASSILLCVCQSATAATVFGGSFDGSVYSIDINDLAHPRIVAQPSSDCSFVAVRGEDGAALCFSAPLDGAIRGVQIASFNVNTGQTSQVATVDGILFGPFYDAKSDAFFAFGRQGGVSGLTFATISLQTLQLTWGANITFGNFTPVGFSSNAWTFSPSQRTVCGDSDNQYLTCISVDSLSATRQTKYPQRTVAWMTSSPSLGVVQLTFTDLSKGCISSSGGTVSVTQIEPNGQGGRLLASIQGANPPLCLFNSAAFVTDTSAYFFSLYKPKPGFWVVPLGIGAATYIPLQNAEFASNIESFVSY
jgi:hypothetical protein